MALQGDLSDFPLTDIIQLLDLSKKTGAIFMQGQRGQQQLDGWLYFRDGKIIGAQLGKLPPLDVPPDLTRPTGDERFVVPDVGTGGSATG